MVINIVLIVDLASNLILNLFNLFIQTYSHLQIFNLNNYKLIIL